MFAESACGELVCDVDEKRKAAGVSTRTVDIVAAVHVQAVRERRQAVAVAKFGRLAGGDADAQVGPGPRRDVVPV